MDTIADMGKFEGILSKRGYTQKDIESIFAGNWLRMMGKLWGK